MTQTVGKLRMSATIEQLSLASGAFIREIYYVPMKFASKLIHGGPVHFCHRPLKYRKSITRNKGRGHVLVMSGEGALAQQIIRWSTEKKQQKINKPSET